MIRLACLFLLLSLQSVMAEDLPAQFRVEGVAADDVLNIRAEPRASSARVGALGPFTTDVEVLALSANGRWGRIGMPEGNGWVAMRYLARQPLPEGQVIPRPLSCLGTEPFWRIGLLRRGDEFQRMGEDRVALEPVAEAAEEDGYQADLSAADGTNYRLAVTRGQCSDGMSDREFGWSARLSLRSARGLETLAGCCTLDHRQGE